MTRTSERGIASAIVVFAVLVLTCVLASSGQSASGIAAPLSDMGFVLEQTATATATPYCDVVEHMAPYSQYGQGLVIRPLRQRDEASGALWVMTWQVEGQPGRTVRAKLDILHCQGIVDDLTYCAADRSTYTNTLTAVVTIPTTGIAEFSVAESVSCCELAEADIVSVDGFPWGASYFDRKATAPWCRQRLTPSATPTPSGTATASATSTRTATATGTTTATETATATATASQTSTTTATATASQTPSATATDTATSTATPTSSATSTWTSTATRTVTQTATATVTETATGTSTATATTTQTNTSTPTPTETPTLTPTPTETSTATVTWTATSTHTRTPTMIWLPVLLSGHTFPTYTPTMTRTPLPTFTNTPTRTPGTPTVTRILQGLQSPKALVLDQADETLFVVTRDTNNVHPLALSTLDMATPISVGLAPYGAALFDGIVYVGNYNSGTVSRIQAATRTRLLPDIAVGPRPTWIDADPISGRVYVVTHGNGGVAVLRGGAIWKILGAGRGAFAVAIDSPGRRAYVSNRDVNTVSVYNIDTDTLIQTLRLEGSPFGLTVNETNGKLYVLHGRLPRDCPANRLVVFSRTGVQLKDITVGDSCDGGWLDVNPLNGRLYIAATAVDQVWILEPDESIRTIYGTADGIGDAPFGLVVDPATANIYVGNKGDGSISVIYDP